MRKEEMGFHADPRNQMVASLMALLSRCVKSANGILSRKSRTRREERMLGRYSPLIDPLIDPPMRLLIKMRNKAVTLKLKRRRGRRGKEDCGFGDGGLWQKAILMGKKCQPLEFSGVLYYDHEGKRLSEPRRSPCPSPLYN
ncbi:uncharacterized protein LOC122639222 [Telopea speciosissima]|uniref:uncharacterized protein LOC122639222 n=1 Tax=Telopea speciosissima TaxID=54955 RepID=UPI001CC7E929|nr:uncharacterized protein LOC122639222 [Telopea speciosissima]